MANKLSDWSNTDRKASYNLQQKNWTEREKNCRDVLNWKFGKEENISKDGVRNLSDDGNSSSFIFVLVTLSILPKKKTFWMELIWVTKCQRFQYSPEMKFHQDQKSEEPKWR